MIDYERLKLFNKVMEEVDNFQQDKGKLRFQVTMFSYVNNHDIIVTITSKDYMLRFVVSELDKDYLHQLFEKKVAEIEGVTE